jgi:hypothetical protein
MFKLDDLNPANTFERRLLEFLASGETLPVKIEHVVPKLDEVWTELAALKHGLRPEAHADHERRIVSLESQMVDVMRALQQLLQVAEDERSKRQNIERVIVSLADSAERKLRHAG